MNNRHITKMAKAVKQQIDKNPVISEKEIEAVLKDYWSDKKAVVWSREDIKSWTEQMHVPINDQLADQVLSFVTEKSHDAGIGVNWESVESAMMEIYPKTFDGFEMVHTSEAFAIYGYSKQGPLHEKKMVPLELDCDSSEDVLEAFKTLHLMSPGKFDFNWDGFEMFDPTDSFDVEETLKEWQEWNENEAPGM
jgi:hypothetical protein